MGDTALEKFNKALLRVNDLSEELPEPGDKDWRIRFAEFAYVLRQAARAAEDVVFSPKYSDR